MNWKNTLFDNTIKKNLTVYKTIRKIYDKTSLRSHQQHQKLFNDKIEKIKNNYGKTFDLSKKPDLNIILITIDCLREDHLSYTGYPRKTTPFLDDIKSFKSSLIATAPWTYPSVSSILTGFYPHNHYAIMDGLIKKFDIKKLKPLRNNVLTLSEILSLYNYSTYLYSTIDLANHKIKDRFESSTLLSFQDCSLVFNDIKNWISKQKNHFFLHVHITDLHEPIDTGGKYKNIFGNVKKLKNIQYWDYKKPEQQHGSKFKEFKENKVLLYDNKLREVDYYLNDFYVFLEKNGFLDNTITAITADHGEEFWDHAEVESKNFYDVRGYAGIGHGHSVFNELIKVPLFMFGPKINNTVNTGFVSGVDIVPTLLDLLEIDNEILFDGRNIFKSFPSNRMILSENTIHGYEKRSIIINNLKFMQSINENVNFLFNLNKDMNEKSPVQDDEMNKLFTKKLEKITLGKNVMRRL